MLYGFVEVGHDVVQQHLLTQYEYQVTIHQNLLRQDITNGRNEHPLLLDAHIEQPPHRLDTAHHKHRQIQILSTDLTRRIYNLTDPIRQPLVLHTRDIDHRLNESNTRQIPKGLPVVLDHEVGEFGTGGVVLVVDKLDEGGVVVEEALGGDAGD